MDNTGKKDERLNAPEVRDILRTIEEAKLENKLPIWDDGRMIVEEGHIALKDEMRFAARKYRAPYGFEQLDMKQEENELDVTGPLYSALTEYKKLDLATPSPLLMGTPGDKRSNPVENRFRDALEIERAESEEGESMDETLSEAGEEMEAGNTPEQDPAERDFTTQGLLQDWSGDDWANTLDEKAWREILSEFDQRVKSETTLEDFKEELWNTVVKFGEPVLMGTGMHEKARKELLSKMIKLRETEQKTNDDACKDSSTPNKKTDDKIIKVERDDKNKTSNLIKDINILKAREGGSKSWKGPTGTKKSNQ